MEIPELKTGRRRETGLGANFGSSVPDHAAESEGRNLRAAFGVIAAFGAHGAHA